MALKFKPVRKYDWLFFAGMAFWLAETWFFGWNDTAQSAAESVCDFIALVAMTIGFVGSVAVTVALEVLRGAEIKELELEEVCERCNCHCHKVHRV